MFISKEESERRRDDPRNFFSPNYVAPSRGDQQSVVEPASVGGETTDETEDEEGSRDNGSGSNGSHTETDSLSNRDLDNILTKAVDPSDIRRRTGILRGKTDVQVAIGTTAMILGGADTGRLYNLSEPQTRAYKDGLSTTKDITEGRPPDENRRLRLSAAKEALAEAAASRLDRALGALTDDKIAQCSAPRVSAIAKDMAVVMDKVTRDNAMPEHIHFHIFKPEMKTVRDYTTVQVTSPIVNQQVGGGTD
jgi:hypothetical protein